MFRNQSVKFHSHFFCIVLIFYMPCSLMTSTVMALYNLLFLVTLSSIYAFVKPPTALFCCSSTQASQVDGPLPSIVLFAFETFYEYPILHALLLHDVFKKFKQSFSNSEYLSILFPFFSRFLCCISPPSIVFSLSFSRTAFLLQSLFFSSMWRCMIRK